jgi:tetratricopeptide (TPR) repeat protein
MIGAYMLGLLAKPMIVTLPCVLLLLDCWPLKRPARWSRLLLEKVPLVVIALASSVVTYVAQHLGGAVDPVHRLVSLRVGNAVWAYGRYIAKTFWPSNLAAFYPYYGWARGTELPWDKVAMSGACLVAITLLAIWLWRRGERSVLIGWLWFIGTLVPVIGLVQVGTQSMADRYSYIPQVGLLIALVWGIGTIVERRPALRLPAKVVAGVFVVSLAISTLYQLRYWRDSYTLFQHALDVTDHNSMANECLAIWYTFRHDSDDALRHYEAALEFEPNLPEAHNNFGGLLLERGDVHKALWHLARAATLNPKYAEARNNLGNALVRAGRIDDALHQYEVAIRLDPDVAEAYFNYAKTLAAVGRIDQAIVNFEHALRLRPGYTNARFYDALALVSAGRVEEGKRQFERVLAARPNWTEAMGQMAWTLATSPNPKSRDPEAAVSLAEYANRLTVSDQPQLLDTLAAAYASAGRFDKAVDTARLALQLATARGINGLVPGITERLALYQASRPFIASTQPSTAPSTRESVGAR